MRQKRILYGFIARFAEVKREPRCAKVVSRVMRKIDSGLWQKSITGGG